MRPRMLTVLRRVRFSIIPDNHVMDEAHYAPKWVKVSPFIAMLSGFVIAFLVLYSLAKPASTGGRGKQTALSLC